MPSYGEGRRFFINEFDESMDMMMLDLVGQIYSNSTKPLEFWINSDGGDASRAFSIARLIEVAKARSIKVITNVLHDAHSSGSIVAVAGTLRKVSPLGSYLLHYGQADVQASGPVELARIAQANLRHFEQVKSHYLANTKVKPDALDEFMLHDNYYLSAEDAVELRFADGYL